MKFYITYFYNIRFFKPNMVPVSTALWDPAWYHDDTHNQNTCFIDHNGIMNGIREESLALPQDKHPEEMCQKDCPYKTQEHTCKFLEAYDKYLHTLNFKNLIDELTRVANEVKLITRFKEEPIVVLIVHEKPDNPCSERFGLQKLFKENDYELPELKLDNCGIIF